MTVIFQNLYLGNEDDSKDSYKYDVIINCTKELPFCSEKTENIRIAVVDNGNPKEINLMTQLAPDVLNRAIICLNNGKKVLVHCKAGQQRSATIVACICLYKFPNMETHEAINYVKTREPIAFFGGINFLETINAVKQAISAGTINV